MRCNVNFRVGSALCGLVKQACTTLTKVCPVIAEYDTKFPFAVYTRTGVTPADSKDRILGVQRLSFSLTVWSDNYEASLVSIEEITQALTRFHDAYGGFIFDDIILENAEETYNETMSAYGQTIYLNIAYHPALEH